MNLYELFLSLLKGGLKVTVIVTLCSMILAFVLGLLAGLARLLKSRLLRGVAGIYVEIFRGTSLMVQMFWIYFALPLVGIKIPALQAGILAIGLNYGAYCSEIVRSSILAVPPEQTEATIALNMTKFQRMRRIILPQAFIIMLPNLGNQAVELLKSTSLVSLITLSDLTYQANILNSSTFQTTEIYGLLLLIYCILAYPLIKGIQYMERKLTAGRSLDVGF